MRVVIVHNRYRSENPSGENNVVDSDIEQLRADGVEVFPYIRDSDEIANWTAVGKAGLAVRPLVSPADAIAFRQMLRRVRPHVVHLHNPFPIISPWIVRTAKAERTPVVQTVHNYRHVCVNGIHFRDGQMCTECVGKTFPWPAVRHGCYQGSRARSIPMAAAVTAHRGTWDLVDRFLPVGEAVADHLRALGIPDYRIEVRPNVVDDPGEPAPLGEGVLFVGRLSEEKGVRALLDAWRRSGVGTEGHVLSIAGDGELRGEVEHAASSDPSIRYLGLMSRAQLDLEYRRCALVVVPSLWPEPDPIAVVTALSHGRPVIASDLGSMPTTVGEDAGWIVAPGGAALSAGLRVALGDLVALKQRSAGARRKYCAERMVENGLALNEVYERLNRVPRGSLVIAGPDGAGKSAIANRIRTLAEDAGVPVEVGHFRPGRVLPRETDSTPVTDPHAQSSRSTMSAGVRTAVVWADFLVAWSGPWRRAARRGLLLLERPWHDQVVDPRRYRLPQRITPLIEVLARAIPRADFAVLLSGEPEHMHDRKPEIGVEEVHRQQAEWRRLLHRAGHQTAEVCSVGVPLATTVAGVVRAASPAAESGVALRWVRPFGFPARVDMHVTSRPIVVSPVLSIYAPQKRSAKVGSRLGGALARVGIVRQAVSPPMPIGVLLEQLGVRADGVAAMRSSARGRWVIGVELAGRLAYVVKAGPEDDRGLENEARFIEHLADLTTSWTVPELVYAGVVDGWRLVMTRAVSPDGLASLPPSLDEVAQIASDLAGGTAGGTPIVHGDLAPWNLRRGRDGRLVVLDWESATFDRRPLWDVIHFVVQQGVLLGRPNPAGAVAQIEGAVQTSRTATRIDHVDVASAILDYIDNAPLQEHPGATDYRAEVRSIVS